MTKVYFPPLTTECNAAQRDMYGDCTLNFTQVVGPPEAACATPVVSIAKLITGKLSQVSNSPDIDDALISPAFDILSRFAISDIQMGEIFDLWASEPTPRDGVCKWVAQNIDYLSSLVPFSYPRKIAEKSDLAFNYGMIGLAAFAAAFVVGTTFAIRSCRTKQAVKYAQLDFLYMLLMGSFSTTIGAIILAIPAQNATCVVSIFVTMFSYTSACWMKLTKFF
jgi:hypothetical protein